MNLYNSKTYVEDLTKALKLIPFLKEISGKSILITGSTGLICSAVIDLVMCCNDTFDSKITVIAAGRSREKFEARFCRYVQSPYLKFMKYDATNSNEFDLKADYVIHGASNAFPKLMQSNPVETMLANIFGIKELLDYAVREKVINTVFISSSEVYGRKETAEPFSEGDYGFLDLLNSRSSYPSSKRAAETLCISYSSEYDVHVNIVRPGHIYGPTASKSDNRVSSQFAFDAAQGKDLVLKSSGSQIRSYCYMLDCATAILTVLLKGKSGEAYNISNPDSIMSIREISQLFADCAGTSLQFEMPSETEKAAFNPMDNSSLKSDKLTDLGWNGCFDGKTGAEHTIKIICESVE